MFIKYAGRLVATAAAVVLAALSRIRASYTLVSPFFLLVYISDSEKYNQYQCYNSNYCSNVHFSCLLSITVLPVFNLSLISADCLKLM